MAYVLCGSPWVGTPELCPEQTVPRFERGTQRVQLIALLHLASMGTGYNGFPPHRELASDMGWYVDPTLGMLGAGRWQKILQDCGPPALSRAGLLQRAQG